MLCPTSHSNSFLNLSYSWTLKIVEITVMSKRKSMCFDLLMTYWSYINLLLYASAIRICYMQFVIILRNKYLAWACLISLRLMCYLCCSLMSANQCKDNPFPTSAHLWNCGWNSALPQHCSSSPFIVSKWDWRAQFVGVKCRAWWGKTRERERFAFLQFFSIHQGGNQ